MTYLTMDELEADSHLGVPVAWIGEEGDAIAFTADADAGRSAILEMGRVDLGGRCVITGDERQAWMRFHVPGGFQSDEWQGEHCRQTDEGALRVFVARGVSDCASIAVAS